MFSGQKTWPQVLAETVRLTKEQPNLLDKVRHLRDTQDLNERAWAEARRTIQQDFCKKREVNSVIRAAGGAADDAMLDAEERHALRQFDQKLLVAFERMLDAQAKALAECDVPVLSTREDGQKLGRLFDKLLRSS
jgi:hypothetical protein